MRADVVENEMEILILTMTTKLTLSFLLLITLTLLSCKPEKQVHLTQPVKNLPSLSTLSSLNLGNQRIVEELMK